MLKDGGGGLPATDSRPIQVESCSLLLKWYGTLGAWPATNLILVLLAAGIEVVMQRFSFLIGVCSHATPLSTLN